MQGREFRRNPFKPTAGVNPPELIGRSEVLDNFAESIENGVGAPERLMRVSGVRGIGKTVLLNALGDVARSYGFRVVNVSSSPGMGEKIVRALTGSGGVTSLTVEPEFLGMKLGSVDVDCRMPRDVGEAMLGAAQRGGLFVSIDEIQDADIEELRVLCNEIQLLMRDGANIAFAFAGLPFAVEDAVHGNGMTFLQRAAQVVLSKLDTDEVQESIEETARTSGMEIASDVARVLADAAAGYPFMVQLVGYYAWRSASRSGENRIVMGDAEKGVALARKKFESSVIEPALGRLSAGQLAYLEAMARCGEQPARSGDVAAAMGRSTASVAEFRKRLITANVIESQGYGRAAFAIPYMRDYLLAYQDDALGVNAFGRE